MEQKLDFISHVEGFQNWLGQVARLNAATNAMTEQELLLLKQSFLLEGTQLSDRLKIAVMTNDLDQPDTELQPALKLHKKAVLPALRALSDVIKEPIAQLRERYQSLLKTA